MALAFNSLYNLFLYLFGYSVGDVPDMANFWLTGFSAIATCVVAILPFIIVYKVVRWFV